MYVAVKGGEKAIAAAHALQAHRRRGDERLPELSVAQIEQQLNLAVDRVMTEGGIADRELAALALKQASGDNVEAIFLLRAYRTTLARLAVSEPVNSTNGVTGLTITSATGTPGGFAGPAMIGWIKDATGSFLGGLYFVSGLLILSAVLTLVLSRSKRPAPTSAQPHFDH